MSQPFVRPDVRVFLDFLAQAPGPQMHEVSPVEARAMARGLLDLAEVPVGEIAVIRDLSCPGPNGGEIRMRLFDAQQSRVPGPAMVFFHGGGWVVGDLETYTPLCAEIARVLDIPVISVDYRLAPEHRWPAAADDCEAAARWVAGSPAALGRHVTGLVVAGDSAGGGLTIVTTLALRDAPAAVPVLAQWPIYPAAGKVRDYSSFELFGDGYLLTKEAMYWFNDHYRPNLEDRRGAPITADQSGMPPTLVTTASLDPLRDQGRAYAAACILAGVPTVYREAAGNIHGWATLRKAIPSSDGDLRGCLLALKPLILEAEATRVMAEAAAG